MKVSDYINRLRNSDTTEEEENFLKHISDIFTLKNDYIEIFNIGTGIRDKAISLVEYLYCNGYFSNYIVNYVKKNNITFDDINEKCVDYDSIIVRPIIDYIDGEVGSRDITVLDFLHIIGFKKYANYDFNKQYEKLLDAMTKQCLEFYDIDIERYVNYGIGKDW